MNKKLKASHSHFLAEKDRLVAELDMLINGNSTDSLDSLFVKFRELAVVNVAISNIESIMTDNSNPDESHAKRGLTLNQLEEMTRMAEAIRKLNEGGDQENEKDHAE